jgi:hypothetical protein
LNSRFPPSEICELARSEDTIVRELANEALARCPLPVLTALLGDPVDSDIARGALRRQVVEYGNEEARRILSFFGSGEKRFELGALSVVNKSYSTGGYLISCSF